LLLLLFLLLLFIVCLFSFFLLPYIMVNEDYHKVKGQLVADVLNIQHAGTGATWGINTKIFLYRNSTVNWQISA